MKKFLFTTAMLFIVGLMWSQVNVTFRVDMSGVSGYTTPEVNGQFNGWCGATCNPMTDANSDGVWETTILLNPGSYEYKFAYDNWFGGGESLVAGTSCTISTGGFTNRKVTVADTDIVMPIVCYGSCSVCGAPERAVTFRVDMSNNSGFTTPTVNGSFNSWSGTQNPLTDANSDGIWEATIYLPDGQYEYKFAYDNWSGQESLIAGSSCTVTNSGFTNRKVVVTGDEVLPVVCWSSCSNCAAALLPKNVTFKVDMQNVSGFTTAYVNGSFNGWCGDCNPLTDANADGIWEATIQLNQDTFEYKFTYDGWTGQENLTPGSSCTSTLGGYTNRSIIVGNANVVLPVACWELCTSCAPPTRNVTFKVNMQNVTGFTTPCVNGSWDGWAGGSHPMTDANADGIWETTIALTDGDYEYKFAYDGWTGSEQLTSGSSCTVTNGGFTNRSLTVNGTAIVLSEVCWASCNSCSAPTRNITFNINMANETGFSTPYISGTMNGWCGDCAPMTDANGDGIYSVTLALQDGTYEYKVSVDGWAGSEQLTQGTPCTVSVPGYTNRRLVVSGVDQNMSVACYASCSDCVQEVAVTFQVNMSQVSGFTTPTVNGQFNGWSGNPMYDSNADGIYTTTINMIPGAYEFKFAADNWNIQENLAPGSACTVTNFGYTNRRIVITGDTVLPVNCWAACGACIVYHNVTFQVDMTNEVGFTIPTVNGAFNGWCGNCLQLTDPDGNGIYTGTASVPSGLNEFKFAHDNWAGQEDLTAGTAGTTTNYGFTNRLINVTHDVVLPVVCYGSGSSCGYAVSNDSPYSAANVQYSVNSSYPNCYAITGSTVNASNSPQSSDFSGKDVWYRFTAASTGVSITLNGSSQDDAIALYSKVGTSFQLVGQPENASSGTGDFERLNYSGLTIGNVYYVSVGAASGTTGSPYSLCLQHLMPSGCSTSVPAAGLNLCDAYKAVYRGAPSQGVTYGFRFNGTGGGATGSTSIGGTNGLIVLSNPALGLRYGGIYTASVDAHYALTDGAGTAEPIDVIGSATGNCSAVTMLTQPGVEVKSTQICPATLLRGNWLIGSPVAGSARICGATSYSFQFTQVVSCADGTVVSLSPSTYTSIGNAPYLQLGVLQNLTTTGTWDVQVRPNFAYGSGQFGAVRRIKVANTAAGAMISEVSIDADERAMVIANDGFAVYPNPSTGEILNVNITDIQSEKINVRILDATGRVVLNNQYSVDGSLNTMIEFAQPLQNGIYMVEYTDNTNVKSQRLVIQH